MAKNCLILLFISINLWHFTTSRPVYYSDDPMQQPQHKPQTRLPANESQRPQRQVVQPKWLTNPEAPSIFGDGKVVVNKQNLQEAAAIRAAIQKAVNEGTFAVATGQNESPTAPAANANANGAVNQQPPPFDPQRLFEFSMSDMPWWQPVQDAAQSQFMKEMQRVWTDFMDNTARLFTNWE